MTQSLAAGRGFAVESLHLVTLFSLAVSARLLEMLGRQPAFFSVRQSRVVDVVLWLLLLCVALPVLLVTWQAIVGLAGRRARTVSLAIVVFVLLSLIALPPLKHCPGLTGPWMLTLACLVGAAATAVYLRYPVAGRMVTLLSPVVLLVPAMFLVASPTAAMLRKTARSPLHDVRVERPAPVVLVVFDEFSGLSLMDAQGQIDARRFPNLAAFSRQATWFRNATTMSTSTHMAVPSLLSGRHPAGPDTAPVLSEYPDNLFTLLGRSHELTVVEAETWLCPPGCSGRTEEDESLAERLWSLVVDTAVLELHILLPRDGPVPLPAVEGRWGNFLDQSLLPGGRPSPHVQRREQFEAFLERIRPTQRPGLYYAHVMLPHVPYSYMPSGEEYPPPPESLADDPNVTHGLVGLARHTEHWTADRRLVAEAYHRYLMQVEFVDRLVGRLVERLKAEGLYDQSLIILTADHGVAFHPDSDRRNPDERTLPEILCVPLLVKRPGQREAAVSDRNVQSADLLPTVADVLGVEVPWTIDGASAFDLSQPERPVKEFTADDPWDERQTVDGRLEAKHEAVRRLIELSEEPTP